VRRTKSLSQDERSISRPEIQLKSSLTTSLDRCLWEQRDVSMRDILVIATIPFGLITSVGWAAFLAFEPFGLFAFFSEGEVHALVMQKRSE
jgi:hypothetical protein